MNYKRKRPKNARAGCLMCKRHKANGVSEQDKVHGSALRKLVAWKRDQRTGDLEGHTCSPDLS